MSRASILDPTLMGQTDPLFAIIGNLAAISARQRGVNQMAGAEAINRGFSEAGAREMSNAQLLAGIKQRQQEAAQQQMLNLSKVWQQQNETGLAERQAREEIAARERMSTATNAARLQEATIQAGGQGGGGSQAVKWADQRLMDRIKANEAAGMSPAEAFAEARRTLGPLEDLFPGIAKYEHTQPSADTQDLTTAITDAKTAVRQATIDTPGLLKTARDKLRRLYLYGWEMYLKQQDFDAAMKLKEQATKDGFDSLYPPPQKPNWMDTIRSGLGELFDPRFWKQPGSAWNPSPVPVPGSQEDIDQFNALPTERRTIKPGQEYFGSPGG